MDKLKQILESLTKLEKLAQAEVDAGEFHLLPVLRSVQSATVVTQQRINALEQWAAEQSALAAEAKVEAKVEAKQTSRKVEPEKVAA